MINFEENSQICKIDLRGLLRLRISIVIAAIFALIFPITYAWPLIGLPIYQNSFVGSELFGIFSWIGVSSPHWYLWGNVGTLEIFDYVIIVPIVLAAQTVLLGSILTALIGDLKTSGSLISLYAGSTIVAATYRFFINAFRMYGDIGYLWQINNTLRIYLGFVPVVFIGFLGIMSISRARSFETRYGLTPSMARAAIADDEDYLASPPSMPMSQSISAVGLGSDLREESSVGLPATVDYAGFGIRLAARIIDFCFCVLVFAPVVAGISALLAVAIGVNSTDIAVVIMLAVLLEPGLWELAYYLVGASHGQTVGKRALGIKVCGEDGNRIGFWKALGRQFLSLLSSLVLGIGWLAPLWSPKKQTWHDSMTNTVVIRDRDARLARPAIVWGLIWALLSAGIFGSLASVVVKSLSDADSSYDYMDDSNYEHFDGWCDEDYYWSDPDC